VGWADEMRIGLRGMVRRVWAPRGVKVRQRLQLEYKWRYLLLALDVRRGRIWWTWTETLKGQELLGAVGALPRYTDFDALVWDRAPGHQLVAGYEVGLRLVEQPAYAPELNPVERLIEELRRAVEGLVYAGLDEKVAAVDAELIRLDADPERVRRLVGWDWITKALDSLPQPIAV
jgi:hypothetical protein